MSRHARTGSAGLVEVPLLPLEKSMPLMLLPPTTTLSFMSGSARDAECYFRSRLSEIVAANPWLASRLDRGDRGIAAFYSGDAESARRRCSLEVHPDLAVPRQQGSTYEALLRRLQPSLCSSAIRCVGNGRPLFRVSLVPSSDVERSFVLVISASHVLLDGHGLFAVGNMLRDAQLDVRALNPHRRFGMVDKIHAALGGEHTTLPANRSGFWSFIGYHIRSGLYAMVNRALRNTRYGVGRISNSWVAERKAEASGGSGDHSGLDRMSTNDVVFSNICTILKPCLAQQAMNFRNLLEDGCSDDDMGNYWEQIMYTPENYASPALIRRSVTRDGSGVYVRAAPWTGEGSARPTPLPSTIQHMWRGIYVCTSNWKSFWREASIPGVTEELMLPLFNYNECHFFPPMVMTLVYIFRAADGADCVLVVGSQRAVEKVLASPMVERWEVLDGVLK